MPTTDRPWWTCDHTSIGLPGCPTCDAMHDPERGHLRAARTEIDRLTAENTRLRAALAEALGGDSEGSPNDAFAVVHFAAQAAHAKDPSPQVRDVRDLRGRDEPARGGAPPLVRLVGRTLKL